MSKKCPCIKCICRPMCGGKNFSDLMNKCKLVANYYYLGKTSNFTIRLAIIINILDPVWRKRLFNI